MLDPKADDTTTLLFLLSLSRTSHLLPGNGESGVSRAGGRADMRAREMHPLCCIAIDGPGPSCGSCSGGGGQAAGEGDKRLSPPPLTQSQTHPDREARVAGVLHKWTNFGKGWRSRWFSLRGGVLSYSKVRVLPDPAGGACGSARGGDFRLIGDPSAARLRRKTRNPVGIVHLKVSSFRESKSDDRRFYIFSATKTLHLKTNTNKDRIAWIEALISARCTFMQKPLSERISFLQTNIPFSTEKLRNRLLKEGLDETLIRDCEQIMQLEFSQLKHAYQEHFNLLSFRKLEEVNVESEAVGFQEIPLLTKNGFLNSDHGKFSESSTTESSDDVERQEVDDDLSAEDEVSYYEAKDSFSDSYSEADHIACVTGHVNSSENIENSPCNLVKMHPETEINHDKFAQVERRKFLPVCTEKEKGISLWSIIKDNVGKDLTRVCLPVYFNEPLSSLQKCFEDMEYSYLLDQAYEYGKMGNSLMRILNVAAFAVSGYASSDGRPCKPFNPLLGETYEADFPEKGVRFFSEKVSHHPMLIACHCEGRGWKFWGDSNLKSKFWGRSIQLDPVGVLTLEFDDGEIFQWSKVTTSIYNLIFGKIYCDHHGVMHIQGNRQYSCNLKFKEQSLLDRNPRQVQGYVEDICGNKVANLVGKWDDSMYYTKEGDLSRAKSSNSPQESSLLWKRNDPSPNPTRYNLSSFAITLNELTSELQEKLPPTDSRRRPDQRHLENGEYEKANSEKQRLEKRQRMSRKLQENGWKPRWFHRDVEDGTFHYVGGYWEAREHKNWDGCPDIFGEFTDDIDLSSIK